MEILTMTKTQQTSDKKNNRLTDNKEKNGRKHTNSEARPY